jgi:hypothetical protein
MVWINLILGLIWLLGALVFLCIWLSPTGRMPTIWNTGISWGWMFLVMALYNLSKWWLLWSAQRRQQALQQKARRRWQEQRDWKQPTDPTFDFSEGPPPPSGEGRH